MKALILNSGLGSRMGEASAERPKCLTPLPEGETILSRQLKQLAAEGIAHVVITTGPFEDQIRRACAEAALPLKIDFVPNPVYRDTNYIYSIYCARELLRGEDLVLMHGDLVFENEVLTRMLAAEGSRMAVSSALPLPERISRP